MEEGETASAPERAPSARASWARRIAGAALGLALLGVGGLALLGFAGSLWWRFDLLASFRVQYAAVLAVLVVALAALRWWWAALAGLLLFAVNAVPLAPLWLPDPPAHPGGPTLTVAFHNLHGGGAGRLSRLEDHLRQGAAGVVVLGGLTDEWSSLLRGADLGPYEVVRPSDADGPYRLAVLSRVPVEGAAEIDLGSEGRTSGIVVRTRIGGREVVVLGVRTRSPRDGVASLARDRELADVAAWAAAESDPTIVVGDLNVTPWSHSFRTLLRDGSLHDSSRGRGWQPTWPDRFGPLMIPIDHALLGEGLVAVGRRTGPSLGSEHRSVEVDVAVA